jgi:hypothetical protein
MEELVILAAIGVVVLLFKVILYFNRRADKNRLTNYFNGLDRFKIDLEAATVKGKSWRQNVPVDLYGNELNPSDDDFYTQADHSPFRFKDKYHKDTYKMKFQSTVIIPINYRNISKKVKIELPVEAARIMIKFHLEKQLTVYIDPNGEREKLILDFRAMNFKGLSTYTIYVW